MRRLLGLLILAGLALAAAEKTKGEKFVFEVKGLVCEESSQAIEEALQGFTQITFMDIDLMSKEVTLAAPAGKYTAKELIQAIDSAEDSQGPMKAKLKKPGGAGKSK